MGNETAHVRILVCFFFLLLLFVCVCVEMVKGLFIFLRIVAKSPPAFPK